MPQVIGPYGLVPLVMRHTLDLRRTIARLLHHTSRRVHRDPHALAPKLVSDLAGPQPRVPFPLRQDLAIALCFDGHRSGPAGRRFASAVGCFAHLFLPAVDRKTAHIETLRRLAHAMTRSVLDDLRSLRWRVPLRDTAPLRLLRFLLVRPSVPIRLRARHGHLVSACRQPSRRTRSMVPLTHRRHGYGVLAGCSRDAQMGDVRQYGNPLLCRVPTPTRR